MKKRWIVLLVAIAGVAGYAALAPDVVAPAPAWEAPAPPALEGVMAPNTTLQRAHPVARGQIIGPESSALDRTGMLYAGTADGRIVKIDLARDHVETFTQTGTKSAKCGSAEGEAQCGRVLGVTFDREGKMFVADSARGLLSISPSGGVRVLATTAKGVPFKFTDDLDVASDGRVYFSDASSKYDRPHYREDIVEGNPYGRLLRWDPKTGDTEVLLDGLYFANGVQLAADESFVLVVETARYRVQRYWLSGPKVGTSDVFADNLPGIPDNIRRASGGGWWLAMGAKRSKIIDFLHARPDLKRVFVKMVPLEFFQRHVIPKVGLVLRLDATGRIEKSLWDPTGESVSAISEASERDGKLYIGSISNDHLGVLDLSGI